MFQTFSPVKCDPRIVVAPPYTFLLNTPSHSKIGFGATGYNSAPYEFIALSFLLMAHAVLTKIVVKTFAKSTVAIMAVAVLFSSTPSLLAVTMVRVSANSGISWITLSGDTPDVAVFDGSLGKQNWSVNVSGFSKLDANGLPVLNLGGIVTSSAAGTLLIEFSQNGFSAFPINNSWETTLDSANPTQLQSLGRASTVLRSYAGLSSGIDFEKTSLLGVTSQVLGPGSSTNSFDSRVGIPGYVYPDQYSLTMTLSIYHGGAGDSTFTALLTDSPALPENGTTVSLLGFALLALAGFASWMKRMRCA